MPRIKVWADDEILYSSDLNAEFDNVLAQSVTPDSMDDSSEDVLAMQTAADPYPAGSVSLPTSLRGEIQRLRYLIKQITGETYWYVDPDTTLAAIQAALTASVVLKSLFDANTILAATSDNTPEAVTIAEDRVVGRKTGGNITALTLTQLLDMLGSCAEGDIICRTASGWTRLTKGTSLQIFRMKTDGTGPEWATDARMTNARPGDGTGSVASATNATNATNAGNADTVDGLHLRITSSYNSGTGVYDHYLELYAKGAWRRLGYVLYSSYNP